MSEETNADELTLEQKIDIEIIEAGKLRDTIVQFATDEDYTFNIIFAALAQVAVTFLFDYNLVDSGELSEENIDTAVTRFNEQVAGFAALAFGNLRENAKREQGEAVTAEEITQV